MVTDLARFARQQCRAWIETGTRLCARGRWGRFARQQCRAWIETRLPQLSHPASQDSPGSNAGRGLKQSNMESAAALARIRPAAMPGVD